MYVFVHFSVHWLQQCYIIGDNISKQKTRKNESSTKNYQYQNHNIKF